ncbi:unnamed protein product [Lepeophtheirus salmonis]|uniref:(salmon louse) hypothetical protein n=1 Tax=Lepeophtheirus salmonis TaxID=72036 RepID=A0A7R8CSI6_LEPSM|nr:unnamed protein product [Lepeophtheirus salmonis]CAF2914411.1 unnamed protein product [Lepeophtheirus salmonis]
MSPFEYEKVLKKQCQKTKPDSVPQGEGILNDNNRGGLERSVTCTKGKSQATHDDPNADSITPSKEPSSVPEEEELFKNKGNAPQDGEVANNDPFRHLFINESDVNSPQNEITPRDAPLSVNKANNSLARQFHRVCPDEICKRRSRISPQKPNKPHLNFSKELEHYTRSYSWVKEIILIRVILQ